MIASVTSPKQGCVPNERDLTIRFEAEPRDEQVELVVELTNHTREDDRIILDLLVPAGWHICPTSWSGQFPVHRADWDDDAVFAAVGSGESVVYRAALTRCAACQPPADEKVGGVILAIIDPVDGPALVLLTAPLPE